MRCANKYDIALLIKNNHLGMHIRGCDGWCATRMFHERFVVGVMEVIGSDRESGECWLVNVNEGG